jgi:hypothetical protein
MFIFATYRAFADISYVSDGEMPDFPQIWGDQSLRAICEAASTADVMWYFDQHGYAGLVAHQDPRTWRADGKDLVFLMAKYIYGKDPANGRISPLGQGTTFAALGKYIRGKGKYAGQPAHGDQGLVVDHYSAGDATYAKWARNIADNRVNIGSLSWRKRNDIIAQHSMASAGVDSDSRKLIVTHGWGDHPAEMPPYKKPPYAEGEEPYINEYPMEVVSSRASIPNPGDGTVELFRGNKYGEADRMAMSEFFNIHPRARAKVEIRRGQGMDFNVSYFVHVTNDSFEPIFQYIQEVETPIDDVTAPPGWQAVPWTSTSTPDITRPPFQSAPPPYEDDPIEPPNLPVQNGILWYSRTDPILPGDTAWGFVFDTSAAFDDQLEDSMSFVSSALSVLVDPESPGLATELLFPSLDTCGG